MSAVAQDCCNNSLCIGQVTNALLHIFLWFRLEIVERPLPVECTADGDHQQFNRPPSSVTLVSNAGGHKPQIYVAALQIGFHLGKESFVKEPREAPQLLNSTSPQMSSGQALQKQNGPFWGIITLNFLTQTLFWGFTVLVSKITSYCKGSFKYIIELVMIHQFYSSLTSDHQPKKSYHLNLLVPTWLFASILL